LHRVNVSATVSLVHTLNDQHAANASPLPDGNCTAKRISPGESRPLTLFVALFFAAWTVRAFALAPVDQAMRPGFFRQAYLDAIRLAIWVAPAVLYIRWIDRGSALTALKLTTPIRPRGLLRAGLIATVYLVGSLLIDSAVTGRRIASPLEIGADAWISVVVALTVVCFAEEVLFRGFLLPKTTALLGFWRANLLTSALFAAIHWPGWLAFRGLRPELATLSLSVFLLGLVLGYVLRATDSLWPCVAVHFLNNALARLLATGT
jgi:uncharacterized protein